MSDYSYAAEQIQEEIIRHYLKTNPTLAREDVIARSKNGRVVMTTLRNVFAILEGQNEGVEASPCNSPLLRSELSKGGDEQQADCEISLANGWCYMEKWIASHTSTMPPQGMNRFLNSLTRKQTIVLDRLRNLTDTKNRIVQAMKLNFKPSPTSIKALLRDYLRALLDLCKARRILYRCELNLGERLVRLQKNPDNAPDLLNSPSASPSAETECDALHDSLARRREKFYQLQELIKFLEQTIRDIVQMLQMEELKEEPLPKKNPYKIYITHRKR